MFHEIADAALPHDFADDFRFRRGTYTGRPARSSLIDARKRRSSGRFEKIDLLAFAFLI